MNLLNESINEVVEIQDSHDAWANSKYEFIDKLKADFSGKVGEVYLKKLCDNLSIESEDYGDVNSRDNGHYDITINGKRVEVKTARLGKQGSFQHENLIVDKDVLDYFAFVDIEPNRFYLTVIKRETFKLGEKHSVLNKTITVRKSGATKLDFSKTTIKKGLSAGVTIVVDDLSNEEIKRFLTEKIV